MSNPCRLSTQQFERFPRPMLSMRAVGVAGTHWIERCSSPCSPSASFPASASGPLMVWVLPDPVCPNANAVHA